MRLRAECVATHKLVHVQLARELVHVQLLRERQPADGPPLARTLKQRAQRNTSCGGAAARRLMQVAGVFLPTTPQ